jgi:hypothetical protein
MRTMPTTIRKRRPAPLAMKLTKGLRLAGSAISLLLPVSGEAPVRPRSFITFRPRLGAPSRPLAPQRDRQ